MSAACDRSGSRLQFHEMPRYGLQVGVCRVFFTACPRVFQHALLRLVRTRVSSQVGCLRGRMTPRISPCRRHAAHRGRIPNEITVSGRIGAKLDHGRDSVQAPWCVLHLHMCVCIGSLSLQTKSHTLTGTNRGLVFHQRSFQKKMIHMWGSPPRIFFAILFIFKFIFIDI